MMKKLSVVFSLCVAVVFTMASISASMSDKDSVFPVGEKFEFDIKKLGLDVGNASLTFNGKQVIDGREVYLITFVAESLNFYDEEKIFVDPKTFYPFKVVRDLDIWGSEEKITEVYDEDKGLVTITKTVKDETTEMVIEKKERIDNLYCFIYRFRQEENIEPGRSFVMNLPTADLKITLLKETSIKAAGEKYDSYFIQSDPKKYRVWFDTSKERIPLRIDAVSKGGTNTMILKETN